ncbi:diiron oxygenase [Catellatospora sp. KI3]|uniref:diiron oxygenase n=1 Tax=Catellatospora sp. KI3 TaxID=3041620 RepID=UPI0024821F4B|nr:diiron oxygenase [Catellatospora sp. KI3]MDI1465902.1 diiron oxygenase [Catellatospora sp. KI3]
MTGDPFGDWYDAAGVRGGTRRLLRDETEQGLAYFPEKLVPYLDHELVKALGPEARRDLTVRHLYQFLLATTHLETRIVNRGAERIANNRVGLHLPARTRMNAFKVYCDEGYHALYSLDLAEQVEAATGVTIPGWDFGGFTRRLDDTAARLLPDAPVLAQLLQVVVFETLITAVLNELPNDPGVVTTVRELTRDHARDEGRHHRFFAAFFHELWTGLDANRRAQAALALPAFIEDCLRFDTLPAERSLTLAGLAPGDTVTVLADTFDRPQRLRENAAATVRMCRSAGVFDVPGAVEAFAGKGLIDG